MDCVQYYNTYGVECIVRYYFFWPSPRPFVSFVIAAATTCPIAAQFPRKRWEERRRAASNATYIWLLLLRGIVVFKKGAAEVVTVSTICIRTNHRDGRCRPRQRMTMLLFSLSILSRAVKRTNGRTNWSQVLYIVNLAQIIYAFNFENLSLTRQHDGINRLLIRLDSSQFCFESIGLSRKVFGRLVVDDVYALGWPNTNTIGLLFFVFFQIFNILPMRYSVLLHNWICCLAGSVKIYSVKC